MRLFIHTYNSLLSPSLCPFLLCPHIPFPSVLHALFHYPAPSILPLPPVGILRSPYYAIVERLGMSLRLIEESFAQQVDGGLGHLEQ